MNAIDARRVDRFLDFLWIVRFVRWELTCGFCKLMRRPSSSPVSMSARRLWPSVLLGAALSATGCGASPALTPTPALTETPVPAAGNLPPGCDPIELRSPRGASIDLSGTWTTGTEEAGNEIRYELRQSGECLWGRGFSAYRGEEPGESFDMVLVGTARSDFTAELDLLELHVKSTGGPAYQPFGHASLTLEIRFEGGATDERTVLEIAALRARPMRVGGDVIAGYLFGTGGPVVGAVLTRSP
jgi:hypothetical protein